MELVQVELGDRSYNIIIDSSIMSDIGTKLLPFDFSSRVCVITNPVVHKLYGKTVIESMIEAGFECSEILIPDGEEYKDYFWTYHILTSLLERRIDRNSCLIALGGGVIGDITGFAASIYMRGIHFIQVPTTLLSQVDSSVGGKTGVNHMLGKNMIGAFYQPKLVCIDTNTLKTLPEKQLLCGIAEIIKYGIICDDELFSFMEQNRDRILKLDIPALKHIIKRSCEIKADIVSKDERESGMRALLNFGHTIGHAIETATGYRRYLHGEAVAIGMHLEARLSQKMGLLDRAQVFRIKSLLDDYGLPSELPPDLHLDRLIGHMKIDKKVEAGQIKLILPERIGKVIIKKAVVKNLKNLLKL